MCLFQCAQTCIDEVFCTTFLGIFLFPCLFAQNKKQRKMVREAVLKSKDPRRILEEIEKIETLGMDTPCMFTTVKYNL